MQEEGYWEERNAGRGVLGREECRKRGTGKRGMQEEGYWEERNAGRGVLGRDTRNVGK